jgi:hypothetical protein
MRLVRTCLTVAVAIAIPVTLFTFGAGVASAKTPTLKGTITCTSFTATVNFNPPLVPGSATSKKDTETSSGSTLGGCTSSTTGAPASAVSVAQKTTKLKSNACSALSSASDTGASFTIDWPGIKASKVKFTGAGTTSTGYSLSGGIVKGSFATTSASANIVIAQDSINAISACDQDEGPSIPSITISGGSMTL